MNWEKILKQSNGVKVEVTLQDLIEFTDYIFQKGLKSSVPNNNEKEYGGVEFAMEITGMAKSTIYNKCSAGKLKYHKNGKLYFLRSELEEYIKQRKTRDEEIDITDYMK